MWRRRNGGDRLKMTMSASEMQSRGATRQQIYVHARAGLPLPLQTSPVKFAVRLKDGRLSSLWTVEVGRKGDVYICSRDLEGRVKISLHNSGQQHAVIHLSNNGVRPERMEWKEPPLESPMPASVKLFFPVWSAGMGPTRDLDAKRRDRMLEKNHVLIEGECSEDTVIVVSFSLTPPNVTILWPPKPPMGLVAVLPVSAEKELHIIARREPRPHLRAGLEAKMNAGTQRRAVSGRGSIDTPYLRLLGGQDEDGVHYVAAVTVMRNAQGVELVQCQRAFVDVG